MHDKKIALSCSMYWCLTRSLTSFRWGNLFLLSRRDGGGTSASLRGSRERASRNRLSGGRCPSKGLGLPIAPFSSSVASESEWERVCAAVQGEHGDLGALQGLSWGEKTCAVPPSDWRTSFCIWGGEGDVSFVSRPSMRSSCQLSCWTP